jgi:two-component system, OmpR family, phosphate regulon sensor histidine kinase PhoR
MVKEILRLRRGPGDEELAELHRAADRGRYAIEESGEIVAVLDEGERVVAASRRARETFPEIEIGGRVPESLLRPGRGRIPNILRYDAGGRRETLLRIEEPGLLAYEELRSGFTAVVSHELRTPLARMLALLETALLPGADQQSLIEQARAEIEQSRELIDEVLFLSELETGREVVSLGATPALPVLEETLAELRRAAERAGVVLRAEGDPSLELPVRPRMLRVVAENLAENAIRYAGPGSEFVLSVAREDGRIVLRAADDGAGVADDDVGRLFERFYRADRARASRGTGLGLAIVKHIVTAAGGTVEAGGGPGHGLEIACSFPE